MLFDTLVPQRELHGTHCLRTSVSCRSLYFRTQLKTKLFSINICYLGFPVHWLIECIYFHKRTRIALRLRWWWWWWWRRRWWWWVTPSPLLHTAISSDCVNVQIFVPVCGCNVVCRRLFRGRRLWSLVICSGHLNLILHWSLWLNFVRRQLFRGRLWRLVICSGRLDLILHRSLCLWLERTVRFLFQ